jgi:hypothetical protein
LRITHLLTQHPLSSAPSKRLLSDSCQCFPALAFVRRHDTFSVMRMHPPSPHKGRGE